MEKTFKTGLRSALSEDLIGYKMRWECILLVQKSCHLKEFSNVNYKLNTLTMKIFVLDAYFSSLIFWINLVSLILKFREEICAVGWCPRIPKKIPRIPRNPAKIPRNPVNIQCEIFGLKIGDLWRSLFIYFFENSTEI